jgi:Phosphotransferase enzyme family
LAQYTILGQFSFRKSLVNEVHGRWRLCGFFDFDDARIGFHEYDLASAGLFMMLGPPHLLRAFLQAYGYAERELNEKLTARLMVYTLLYRYRDLTWILGELVTERSRATLAELGEAIYGLGR